MTLTDYQRIILDAVRAGRVTYTCAPGGGRSDYVLDRDKVLRQDVTLTIRKLQAMGVVSHVPASLALRSVSNYIVTVKEIS